MNAEKWLPEFRCIFPIQTGLKYYDLNCFWDPCNEGVKWSMSTTRRLYNSSPQRSTRGRTSLTAIWALFPIFLLKPLSSCSSIGLFVKWDLWNRQYYSVYKQRNNLLTEDELNTIVEKYVCACWKEDCAMIGTRVGKGCWTFLTSITSIL